MVNGNLRSVFRGALSAGWHTVVNGNLRSVFRGALSVGCVTRWLMATYVVCFVVICLSGGAHGG